MKKQKVIKTKKGEMKLSMELVKPKWYHIVIYLIIIGAIVWWIFIR